MTHSPLRPCIRCGVLAFRRNTTTLCVDCRSTMSAAERELWRRPAKPVESDHRKVAA